MTAVKASEPQPFREIVTCPESSCVLPGELPGGQFAAVSVQQVLADVCLFHLLAATVVPLFHTNVP
jgi:hypothetical protein